MAPETFYNKARILAYDAAFREVSRALALDHNPDLLANLDYECASRADGTSSGSPAKSYYERVRGLIQQYRQQP